MYRIQEDAKKESMLINMGPSHPAMHGTIRIMLELDGEVVRNAELEVGYLHRGFEKTCEHKTYFNLLPYTDRLNYVSPLINNLSLIVVGIWLYTGFAMTILSASIKGVPDELLEAARIDGANELQVFFRIMVPLILPTITVVMTTMTIFTLKLFDVIYVMTGGNFDSNVVAVRMYQEMYINFESGRSAAIAVVLLILIIPVLIYNIRRFQEQEAIR